MHYLTEMSFLNAMQAYHGRHLFQEFVTGMEPPLPSRAHGLSIVTANEAIAI